MNGNECIFIKEAMFFEGFNPKSKPIKAEGRDFYSLSYRYSGRVKISCGGIEYISAEDTVTFMPKGLSYTTETLEDAQTGIAHFDFDCESVPTSPAVISVKNSAVRSLFQTLTKSHTGTGADFGRMAIFYELLDLLNKMSISATDSLIPEKIRGARERIEREYANPYLSVDSIAADAKISATYLRREFRRLYGVPPIKHLKEVRLQNAKRLILSTKRTVSEIAELCGYTGTSYFIQDFHKATGESPDRYRKRAVTL